MGDGVLSSIARFSSRQAALQRTARVAVTSFSRSALMLSTPFRFVVQSCVVAVAGLCAGVASAESLYVIGNSLTNDMVPDGVETIAGDSGHSLTAGFHIRAAATVNYIVSNPGDVTYSRPANFDVALRGQAWDFVTFQPYPGDGSTLGSDVAAIRHLIDLNESGPSGSTSYFI